MTFEAAVYASTSDSAIPKLRCGQPLGVLVEMQWREHIQRWLKTVITAWVPENLPGVGEIAFEWTGEDLTVGQGKMYLLEDCHVGPSMFRPLTGTLCTWVEQFRTSDGASMVGWTRRSKLF